ncbi:MAG TPA: M23 family metallopeptidase [Treponemataceae bacterium]|nr:M23 family metallopeptidase [Treponemataceae bacterium]
MSRRMMTALILAATVLAGATAFEWPVSELYPVSIFGQKKEQSVECGIVLEKTELVRAAGSGTVLLTIDSGYSPYGFPGTLGNAVIVAHDEGLVTIYGNLSSLDRIEQRSTVETGTILGEAGASGCTREKDLLFQVMDQTRRLYLNPLLLLPAQTDTRRPVIRKASLTGGNGRVYPLESTRSVRQGKYRLYADISDTINNSANTLAPFRVTILLNGSEYATIPFEIITANSGTLQLGSTGQDSGILYDDKGLLYLGEISLARGKNDISIIARDITGNERGEAWSISAE